MIRTESIGKEAFNYIKYETDSDVNVFFLHGYGEGGPQNGSKLTDVENFGWPALAKSGVPLPFNLYCPQFLEGPNNSSISTIVRNNLIPFIEKLPNRRKVGLAGWSFGAGFILNYLLQGMPGYENNGLIDFYVAFAGRGSGTPVYTGITKPLCLVAGTADAAISYNSSKVIYNNINADLARRSELLLVTIEGGTHVDVVRKGCNPNEPSGAQVLDFIARNTKPDIIVVPPVREPATVFIENGEAIFVTESKSYKAAVTEI